MQYFINTNIARHFTHVLFINDYDLIMDTITGIYQ